MGGRRRRGLADLIDEIGAAPQESESEGRDRKRTATGEREEVPESRPGTGRGATVEPAAREESRDEAMTPAPRVPKYLALERKEARLRRDQVDSLALLARRVNRRKASRGASGSQRTPLSGSPLTGSSVKSSTSGAPPRRR